MGKVPYSTSSKLPVVTFRTSVDGCKLTSIFQLNFVCDLFFITAWTPIVSVKWLCIFLSSFFHRHKRNTVFLAPNFQHIHTVGALCPGQFFQEVDGQIILALFWQLTHNSLALIELLLFPCKG